MKKPVSKNSSERAKSEDSKKKNKLKPLKSKEIKRSSNLSHFSEDEDEDVDFPSSFEDHEGFDDLEINEDDEDF
ncbi:MAG: hypothetical protein RLZZ46_1185 [Bacteroidota bacterium]|jgi:hypothetical protein